MTRFAVVASPLGDVLLAGDERGLDRVHLQSGPAPLAVPAGWRRDSAALSRAAAQLAEYFAGDRTVFDLPLAPAGTPFQRRVWDALCAIPYGETTTYGALARRLGRPAAARAVGAANGRNPLAVVVPCHRVVGASGALTGYGGGLESKRRLLALERATMRACASSSPVPPARSGSSSSRCS